MCAAINNFPDLICPNFPADLPCECPIPPGMFTNDITIPFDEKWLAIEGGADVSPIGGTYGPLDFN